jgi:DNA-binding NarL/FixJ family response regulator
MGIKGMRERVALLGGDLEIRAASLAEARGMLHDIDVVVIDLGLPDATAATSSATARRQPTRTRCPQRQPRSANITRAPSSGAAWTTADLDQLADAVRRLHRGATQPSQWISP